MKLKRALFFLYLVFSFSLVGCGTKVIASTPTDDGTINVYKSGSIYKYEYIVYDIEKDKEVVKEEGRVENLSELEEKYGVSFSYTE